MYLHASSVEEVFRCDRQVAIPGGFAVCLSSIVDFLNSFDVGDGYFAGGEADKRTCEVKVAFSKNEDMEKHSAISSSKRVAYRI